MDASLACPDPGRALAVDSYPDNADVFTDLLRVWGFESVGCLAGPTALDLALERPPCLIISDIELAGFSGVELTRRLRADPRTAGCLVVIVTADLRSERVRQAWEAGCNLVLPKPCVPEDLRHALIAACRGVRMQARLIRTKGGALGPGAAALLATSRLLYERLTAVRDWGGGGHQPRRPMQVLRPFPRARRVGSPE